MPADIVPELQARGLLQNDTGTEIRDLLGKDVVTAYIGFDPTADSLHVGSLLPLLMLVRLQRAGHRPIAIVGGGTGLIGDPSGKEAERPMLDRERLDANVAGLRAQIARYLDFDGPRGAMLLDNADWIGRINLVDFLRDIGKHFSVNAMVQRDSVKTRLEARDQGISYTEFSYMLLQAVDYLELHDRYDCRLQLGGSDQWGNILSGCDLVRRLRGRQVHGLTFPLLTRADGRKFGKSEGGNVWLDPARTSPYEMFQFWLNTEDADVAGYLRRFTFLPLHEVDDLERTVAECPEKRDAQRALAREVTRFVHGGEALARAEHATRVLFEGGDVHDLSAVQLQEVFGNAPSTALPVEALGTPAAALPAVLAASGLLPSRGQARKAIEGGGVYLNDVRVADPDRALGSGDLLAGTWAVLRRGKKAFCLIRVERT